MARFSRNKESDDAQGGIAPDATVAGAAAADTPADATVAGAAAADTSAAQGATATMTAPPSLPPVVPPTAPPDAALAGAGDAVAPDSDAPAKPKRKLTWLWWTLGSLAAAGLVGVTVYMAIVTAGWQSYATELETALEDVKTTAAQDRADTEAIADRLEVVQSQLDTANQRITDLANEEANATDSQDVLRNVVEAMISCADGRQELIDVLTDSSLYFPGTTNAAVERELKEYCQGVIDDYRANLAGN